MGNKLLKGLTIKFGGDTTDLNKALEKVEKQGRSLSSELGQINRALKLDPTNTELLAQKQKVLADAISNTEDKLGTLKEAEKQVQAQFERGEVSQEQVRALRREIIETEAKLIKYKNAVKETAEAEKKLADGAEGAAKELDDQADKTKKAEKATNDMDDSANDLASGGLAALTAAAVATVAAVAAMAEGSREYRGEMGKLTTAFKSSNHSAETAAKTYEELQSIIGETDQSVEAAQQIALLAESEKDAAEWAELAAGVVGRFGDALQPETFYEAANETLKLGTATGAYTQMLEGCGENVDDFNAGLAACSTAQEKQAYMLDVTKRLLGSAATQYKQTNAEVIRANQATEKWNKATAKAGKTVEPVITDIKELGAVLLEDAADPLEDTAQYIRKDLIPAVKSVSSWVRQNGPVIKSTLVGATAALVAYKTATIAAEVAQKGLKNAILATEAAQKALTIAQAATPWGIIITAIVGLEAALLVLSMTTDDAGKPVDILTEEEKQLAAAADEAAQAFRDQQDATKKTMDGISSQMDYTQQLADELFTLADATGKVKEEDQARVQFILGELAEATGEEYAMVDGIIQKYGELKGSIEQVIEQKKAKLLLDAADANYTEALLQKDAAYDNLILKAREYDAQEAQLLEKEKQYAREREDLEATIQAARERGDLYSLQQYEIQLAHLDEGIEKERKAAEEKKAAWEDAALNYSNYTNTITNYEDAMTASLQGNYKEVEEILGRKSQSFGNYSKNVDTETAKVLDALYLESVNAGMAAAETKKNFEKGMSGYTNEMVKEAEANYRKAMAEFADAYADAESVGKDMTKGLTDGAENERSGLLAKARSLVSGFINAARKEADSHSPSRKTMALGEDLGEGTEIGIENKTKDVEKAATKQVSAAVNAYRAQEVNAQKALRGVADQQVARQTAGQMAAASATSPMLERILAAIEAGQVILLDGDAVVGGTADRMDRKLGQLRVLAARGAK